MKLQKRKLTYVSLFSGCGGFDEGFIKNDFECLGAYDIDPIAIEVYNKNVGRFGQVWDLSSGKLPAKITKPVDVVISGSPCQGFSTAGKRRLQDPRNNLLLIGGEIALKLKTKVFIAENVMGSIAGTHKLYWDKLEKMFIKKGYKVNFIKCDATRLGIPQLRKRILMIACNEKKEMDINLENTVSKNLREAISNLEKLSNHKVCFLDKNSIEYKIAKRIKPGQKLSNVRGSNKSIHTWDIPEVFGETTEKEKLFLLNLMKFRRRIRRRKEGDADPVEIKMLTQLYGNSVSKVISSLIKKGFLKKTNNEFVDLAHTFNGKYRRLSFEQPSPTVDTRFGNAKYFLHPVEHRPMTVREAARIQGFRDNFIFHGPIKNQYQMVGNAVPPPISNSIASNIKIKLGVNAKKSN